MIYYIKIIMLWYNYWISVGLLDIKQDQSVKFEIRVPNYCTYIAVGIAKTEEIARQNALKNILLYLADKNEIPPIPKVKTTIIHFL